MSQNQIKQSFENRNLLTLWQKIRFWFFVRKLYREKVASIWECDLDILFIEQTFREELDYRDAEDRKRMEEIYKQPVEKRDHVMLASIEEKIARAKAIKETHRKSLENKMDLEKYRTMIEMWMKA